MQSADDSIEKGTPSLASFVSEATLPRLPRAPEDPNPLSQFPEERKVASKRYPSQKHPARPQVASYTSLAAAIVVAIGAAWWGVSSPSTRLARTEPVAQPAAIVPPAIEPAVNTPAELSSTFNVQPAPRAPVQSVASTVARMETDRIVPPARGTSGAAVTAPAPRPVTPAPRPVTPAPRPVIPSNEPVPAQQPPAVAANPAVIAPSPEPAPTIELSANAPSPPTSRVPAAARPEPEALPSVVARTDQSEIQRALGQYRSAYQLLDAEAARAVWPTVDVRALSRAFDSLTSQQLAFDTCLFEIAGAAATAQCRGSATYTPKVGSRAPKVEPRQWTFHLRKEDEGWKIQTAQARR